MADLPLPAGPHEHDLGVLQLTKNLLDERGALQVNSPGRSSIGCREESGRCDPRGRAALLLVGADGGVALLQSRRQVGRRRLRASDMAVLAIASKAFQEARPQHGVTFGGRVGKEALDVGFGLPRGAIEVQAQHMQHAKERPDVRCRDGLVPRCRR